MGLFGLCNISNTPGNFRSHFTGLFGLCNIFHTLSRLHFAGLFGLCNVFCTPLRLHFTGLFGLCNVFCTPKGMRSLWVFLAFVMFFVHPKNFRSLQVFLAFVIFFIPPGDIISHSTGLFSLCNVFVPLVNCTWWVCLAFVRFFYPLEFSQYGSFWPF